MAVPKASAVVISYEQNKNNQRRKATEFSGIEKFLTSSLLYNKSKKQLLPTLEFQ
jgi:hypothetical protein